MAKSEKTVPAKKEKASSGVGDWDIFSSLRDEFDELLDRYSLDWPIAGQFGQRRRSPGALRRLREGWGFDAPDVDIIEKDSILEVRAELPGVDEKDIDVQVSDTMLKIKGEKKEEHEEVDEESRYHLSERKYGVFERSFPLPDSADKDGVKANFKNGVLVVTIPKSPKTQEKTRSIEVEPG